MGKNNTQLLALAKNHLGEGGARFRRYCGMSGGAWCCAYVTYEFHEGDDSPLFYGGKKVVYCPTAIQWCKANLAQIPIYLALPMDVIFFDWNANNVPDHIGFVRERKSDQEVYTIEGNTSGGIVAEKTRPNKYVLGCFRPAFKATYDTSKPLVIDSYFGYNSIACLQKALKASGHYKMDIDGILGKGTVKALQKRAGVAQDGSWGVKTSKAVQKMVGAKVDGAFGAESTKKLQEWINKQNKAKPVAKPVTKPVTKSKAQQISDKAIELCWAKGTPSSKYAYKGGAPCPNFKTAWNKYFSGKKNSAGCHQFVMCVLKTLGYPTMPINTWSNILNYLKHNFNEVKFTYNKSQLKAGDIWVRKDTKNGKTSYHILIIVNIGGQLMIAEAQQSKTYSHINTNINKALQKHDRVWLFRAK